MSLNSLRDEARNNLAVGVTIVSTQGSDIDIGEQFTVRFTVTNHFVGGEGMHPGHAHYLNVSLRVTGTVHASVEGGNRTIPIADHLGFGNSVSTDVTFNALSALPNGFLSWPSERYANVRVEADFDVVRFFSVVQERQFDTQIDDG